MKVVRIIAIVLIVAGILGLVYGSFSYLQPHTAKLGPLELVVKERKTFIVPIWLSVTGIVAGIGLLVIPKRR